MKHCTLLSINLVLDVSNNEKIARILHIQIRLMSAISYLLQGRRWVSGMMATCSNIASVGACLTKVSIDTVVSRDTHRSMFFSCLFFVRSFKPDRPKMRESNLVFVFGRHGCQKSIHNIHEMYNKLISLRYSVGQKSEPKIFYT